MKKVITFGTFDLFHNGHLNILERARQLGDYLIVGVSSDSLNAKKHKASVMSVSQRANFIMSLHCVDEVFIEESLELKQTYIEKYDADILVMGDDWKGKFDWVSCDVVYLPRTENISTTLMKLALIEEFKRLKVFVVTSGSNKHRGCSEPIVKYMNKIGFMVTEQKRFDDYPSESFDAIIDFNKPVKNLRELYPNTPLFIVDHGASNLKWFLKNQGRYNSVDYFLTAGSDHVESMQSFFGADDSITATAFVKSDLLLSGAESSRIKFCQENNLAADEPIVLYAPTWLKDITDDHREVLNQLSHISNHIICQHVDHSQFESSASLNVVKNNNYNIIEFMKQSDIIISDTSSILQESAALKKPTIQVLMREYTNNPSRDYQLPLTAGTNKFFLAGFPTKPENLARSIRSLGKYEESILFLQEKVLEGTTIKSNPCRDIIEGLINGVGSYPKLRKKSQSKELTNQAQQKSTAILNSSISFANAAIHEHKCTNSLESIKYRTSKFNQIEVDVCIAKDGIIVARKGHEIKHGVDSCFKDITLAIFKLSTYEEGFTALSFPDLLKYSMDKNVSFILNTKETGNSYFQCLREISALSDNHHVLSKFIPQVYCEADLKSAISCGFDSCLIAISTYSEHDVFPDKTRNFLDYAFIQSEIRPIGILLINKEVSVVDIDQPSLLKLYAYGVRVYNQNLTCSGL